MGRDATMLNALYYPYFTPRPEWLRRASLCWNSVHRLRTRDAPEDPERVAQLDEALGGVLAEISFEDEAQWEGPYPVETLREFLTWLDADIEHWRAATRVAADDNALVGLYHSKFPGGWVIEELERRGVAHIRRPALDWEAFRPGANAARRDERDRSSRPVIWLPEGIASHYVGLVARNVADRFDFDLVADARYSTDVVTHSYRTMRGRLAESVLALHLPRDIDEVEPARLREVREELGPRRRRFRAELDAFSKTVVPQIETERDQERAIRDVVELAEDQIRATDAAYTKARLDVTSVPLSVSFAPPAIASVLASLLGVGVVAPAGVAAVAGLAAGAMAAAQRSASAARRASPWSYVLEVGALR